MREQMMHFGTRESKHRRAFARCREWEAKGHRTNSCQVSSSQQHEGDMPVPANEATNFVVIQAHIFGVLKIFLNVPSGSNRLDHLRKCGATWSAHEVVCLLKRISGATTNEQPMASIIFPSVQHGHDRPVKESRTFAALAHREALPVPIMKHKPFDQSGFLSPARRWHLESQLARYRGPPARRNTDGSSSQVRRSKLPPYTVSATTQEMGR